MKTNIYIDGYNLYYGLLKGRPQYKWLDPVRLVAKLLDAGHQINRVRYFTSKIKTYPHDQAAVERQNIYLQALTTLRQVTITYGLYNKRKGYLPALDARCRDCEESGENRLVHIMKFEEKRTDVNLATAMLKDAYGGDAESFVLISGDSDFIAPLDLIRHELGRQVVVFNPQLVRSDLANHASYYKDIPRDLPASCQLPDEIPIGDRGNVLHRPSAWRGQQA